MVEWNGGIAELTKIRSKVNVGCHASSWITLQSGLRASRERERERATDALVALDHCCHSKAEASTFPFTPSIE